jgi:competence protein ComEA
MMVKKSTGAFLVLFSLVCLFSLGAASVYAEGPPLTAKAKIKKVDLNTASVKDLAGLPGIGEKKAAAIVDYRKAHKRFASVTELKKVKGIGEKLFMKIEPMIEVSAGNP